MDSRAVEVFQKENCNAIMAIGGGSAIDVAKCIKIFAKMNCKIDFLQQKIIPNEIPLTVLPTTIGTGAERFSASMNTSYCSTFPLRSAASWGSGLPDGWQIPVSLLVLFFGLSALIVLVHSETYFQINKLRRESELARQQLEEQYKLFLKEQEANEQVRALRHDIQNHLHTIEKMAASDDASDIRQYVSDLQAAAGHAESASVTGNATLDALLTAKMPVFEKNGIRFENYLSLRDVTLFSPMEICTLFANATDNAVEALADSRITDKYIHMSGGIIHENLVVKIKNPYQHELRHGPDHFESTKKIDRPHGYGLMNIERIIEEHRGSVSYKTDDSVFAMVWMVPLESRSSAPNARG